MLVGNTKYRRKIREEIEQSPLYICGKVMKEVKTLKFLGDTLTFNLEESVHETVVRRIGVAKHSIIELRTIIEDTRSKIIGGINIALDIFNSAILQMVLHNCETWNYISIKTYRILNNFFN